ncbi:reverse transcriptase [Plakobranchus ocellatus]|uniref:Reverse transcriptase n=1 Tax=Plakobranchus ocellatus TaxID=259542 RepID=A0AAV4DI88_9GAST|nr:reverse transcriptase [Plakobranchus ocellatus]
MPLIYMEHLPKIDAEAVAQALVDIWKRLGVLKEVLSDQGTQFMSDCLRKVCRLLVIKQTVTTPYYLMYKASFTRIDQMPPDVNDKVLCIGVTNILHKHLHPHQSRHLVV